jgi:hypothetical protein
VELVAVVEHVGAVVRLFTVSVPANALYMGATTGGVPPYVMLVLEAVMVSDALLTVTEPLTY